ncbi:MAG: hypothetical protein R2827_03570 [Bdellovibrionales bacterium]
MKAWARTLLVIIFCVPIIVIFQNCGEGFESFSDGSLNLGSGSPLPGIGDDPFAAQGLTFGKVEACIAKVGTESLVACLDKNNSNPDSIPQTQVDSCVNNVGEKPWDVAHCLFKNGFTVPGYRELTQTDLDSCASAVGQNSVANCLNKKGLLKNLLPGSFSGLTTLQNQLNTCSNAIGFGNVEKCLRKNKFLSFRPVLMKADLLFCQKVVGDNNIPECLVDRGTLGANLTNNIATCISNVGVENAQKCARGPGDFEPASLQKIHVDLCISDVGFDNLAACLTANGLVGDFTQTAINNCRTAVGENNVIKCMRKNQMIDSRPGQDDLALCNEVAGQSNIYNCLSANFGFNFLA